MVLSAESNNKVSPAASTITQQYSPQKAADLLRALAHPMRLQILCRLLDGELSVAGFESELGLRQPSLSQQLGHLREAELVTTRREAKSIFYRLSDDRVPVILDALSLAMGFDAKAARPAARPTTPRAPATPVAKEPHARQEGCGVFSVAGWPVTGKQGIGTVG